MINKAGGKITNNFELNTLAHMTERYPAGSVSFFILYFNINSSNTQLKKY
jgi:hypothetical protein